MCLRKYSLGHKVLCAVGIYETHLRNQQHFVAIVAVSIGPAMPLCCHSFLSRSKHRLTLWLQSPLAVILKPKQIKSVTCMPSCFRDV